MNGPLLQKEIITKTPEETVKQGELLGCSLSIGDIVLMSGHLGAGKTTFVRGMAKGMGLEDRVQSPTFIILREYGKEVKLYHADLYRLGSIEEFVTLDILDNIADGIAVFEWGDLIEPVLKSYLKIYIEFVEESESMRKLSYFVRGERVLIQ